MIELEGLSKTYNNGQTYVVDHINAVFPDGEIIILLGSSGCGKTTTLKMINCLVKPSSGRVLLDGENVVKQNPVKLRRRIGYVFQGVGLFPNMNVAENVSILLKLLKHSKKECRTRAEALLELVDLDPAIYADRDIHELSGGQQQRVGVARALANNPKYLLMDEPFGALDSITRNTLQEELLKINKELKKTIVFVTHDIAEAFRLADKIVIMHSGKIEQMGQAQEILNHPATEFVAELINTHKHQVELMQETMTQISE